ncbi:MAG: YcgN family cysteine cluster protein [Mariprofundaceae bacterium]|nr:YcgN family cysteine cluster protein [Mariprofundaceae bacterium]
MSGSWWEKPLHALNHEQWEQLCDGCGLCCMHKFEDEDSGEMLYTDVACRLFESGSCRCMQYAQRSELVPECMQIRHFVPAQFIWLPATCAYRLRHEGKPLLDWHPLISGNAQSVHEAGISMLGRCVPECEVDEDDLPMHIIDPSDG